MTGQDWLEKDFYATLGVPSTADEAEIKRAYRKLARKYHPDANAGNDNAERRFKDIGEAYSVLSDPEQRSRYDAVRAMRSGARFTAGGSGGPNGSGFEDLLGGLFGGAGGYGAAGPGPGPQGTRTRSYRRSSAGSAEFDDLLADLLGQQASAGSATTGQGRDLTATARVSLRQALQGCEVTLRVSDSTRGMRTVHARLPAGVKDGQKVRVRGKGEQGPLGPGDVLVTVSVENDPTFSWDGTSLRATVPVTFAEAALGATVTVPTFDGTVSLKLPAGTPSGRVFRLRGRGPTVKGAPTDLLVSAQVIVPQRLDGEARAAVETLRRLDGQQDPRADLLRAAEAAREHA